jgi:predicted phage terminase large subunit-like protein
MLKEEQQKLRSPIRFYHGGGGEKGNVDYLEERGVKVNAIQAGSDKSVRAQPFADAWNAGKVLVPARAKWLDEFVRELHEFSGVNDLHDDQVDSAAAAYDELRSKVRTEAAPVIVVEKRRYGRTRRGWA